ncbi:MAG: UDP-4-amino-4,6-dideoxy-N-acetyl-beta-L-altrosamine transaminase [Deltaproteobacteria bacterium]|nr:UDP-4-amino-4,6-dideoxy-N-acetyl-beta-L-altrosamine transaminase [Deltaproteobacteria bacterium]
MIPYSHQTIDETDIAAVSHVLRGDLITQGPTIPRFEKSVAAYCGARFAVAFANGTAALHAACLAADLGPGDEGIVPAISFVATANCLAYVGATPQFADVSPGLPLLHRDTVLPALTPRTKALLPVHFAGATADLPALHTIAQAHGLTIIEDACHALGAEYWDAAGARWRRVGDCAYSRMTVFSFHPVKSIATGEGGMVTTNDPQLYNRLAACRHHGIVRPPADAGHPPWYYEMQTLGFNFRLTELQAALGCTQMAKLDPFISARRARFERYCAALTDIPGIQLLAPNAETRSAQHLAVIHVTPAAQRDRLFVWLREQGIGVQLHYIPIYRHPYYQSRQPCEPRHYPNAEAYFASALSIPLFPAMTDAEQDHVIASLGAWAAQSARA